MLNTGWFTVPKVSYLQKPPFNSKIIFQSNMSQSVTSPSPDHLKLLPPLSTTSSAPKNAVLTWLFLLLVHHRHPSSMSSPDFINKKAHENTRVVNMISDLEQVGDTNTHTFLIKLDFLKIDGSWSLWYFLVMVL